MSLLLCVQAFSVKMDRASFSNQPFEARTSNGNTKTPLNLDLNLTPEEEPDIHRGQSSRANTRIAFDLDRKFTPERDMEIQIGLNSLPYRYNQHQVLALSRLPLKGLKRRRNEPICPTCSRKLIDGILYSDCSISCKVKASEGKREAIDLNKTILDEPVQYRGIDMNVLPVDQPAEMGKQESGFEVTSSGEANEHRNHPSKRICRRKGVPRRAPFF